MLTLIKQENSWIHTLLLFICTCQLTAYMFSLKEQY